MRGLHYRNDVESIEQCVATPPTEAMVMALDAALTFAASRELFAEEQVASLLSMLRVASPLSSESGCMRDAFDQAEGCFVGRRLVSGAELVDRLLDLRLMARAPLQEPSGAGFAIAEDYPLARV